ncbi:MAG: glycosyltransferase family 4 protein [Bacillota bacterium]
MNVLMVVSRLNIGGTETHILSMAQALRRLGVKVGVATEGGPLVSLCRRQGIAVHRLPVNASPAAKAAALAHLVPTRYQIIQLHDSRSFAAAKLISAKCRVPVVLTVHGTYHQRKAVLHGARYAKQVVPVSEAVRSWLRTMGVRLPLVVIPNGIDLRRFSPSHRQDHERQSLGLPVKAQIILHATRFDVHKQAIARKVIKASELVARHRPLLHTVLLGPGPYRRGVKKLASQINHRLGRAAVEVRPPTMQISRYYRSANLVIATGRTALEAMACAKPVIACGIRGYEGILQSHNMARAIRHGLGDHARAYPLRVKKLAADIDRLLARPSVGQALGVHNRAVVRRRFALNTVAHRWLRVYQRLFSGARA